MLDRGEESKVGGVNMRAVFPKLSVSENRNETETIFEFRPKTETKIETFILSCFDLIRVFLHQICIKMTLGALINIFLALLNLHLP
jgi:hypothetical protein